MISIIVCSVRPDVCTRLLNNIKDVTFSPYEIIVIDNRVKKWGICEVYNYAADMAKGEYLCFIHEDVIVKTSGWDEILIRFASETPKCGVIGFGGNTYVAKHHLSWGIGKSSHNYTFPFKNKGLRTVRKGYNQTDFNPVIMLDGYFLFMEKSIWKNNKFDSLTFDGFHFYDMDITTSVWINGYQNFVCFTIDTIHYSKGNYDSAYLLSSSSFRNKYHSLLPLALGNLSYYNRLWAEFVSAYSYISFAKRCISFSSLMICREFKMSYGAFSFIVYPVVEICWRVVNLFKIIKRLVW